MNMQLCKYNIFRRHARMFIEPAIVSYWQKSQEGMLQKLHAEEKVIVGGDMRADSPGMSYMFYIIHILHFRKGFHYVWFVQLMVPEKHMLNTTSKNTNSPSAENSNYCKTYFHRPLCKVRKLHYDGPEEQQSRWPPVGSGKWVEMKYQCFFL